MPHIKYFSASAPDCNSIFALISNDLKKPWRFLNQIKVWIIDTFIVFYNEGYVKRLGNLFLFFCSWWSWYVIRGGVIRFCFLSHILLGRRRGKVSIFTILVNMSSDLFLYHSGGDDSEFLWLFASYVTSRFYASPLPCIHKVDSLFSDAYLYQSLRKKRDVRCKSPGLIWFFFFFETRIDLITFHFSVSLNSQGRTRFRLWLHCRNRTWVFTSYGRSL